MTPTLRVPPVDTLSPLFRSPPAKLEIFIPPLLWSERIFCFVLFCFTKRTSHKRKDETILCFGNETELTILKIYGLRPFTWRNVIRPNAPHQSQSNYPSRMSEPNSLLTTNVLLSLHRQRDRKTIQNSVNNGLNDHKFGLNYFFKFND